MGISEEFNILTVTYTEQMVSKYVCARTANQIKKLETCYNKDVIRQDFIWFVI